MVNERFILCDLPGMSAELKVMQSLANKPVAKEMEYEYAIESYYGHKASSEGDYATALSLQKGSAGLAGEQQHHKAADHKAQRPGPVGAERPSPRCRSKYIAAGSGTSHEEPTDGLAPVHLSDLFHDL